MLEQLVRWFVFVFVFGVVLGLIPVILGVALLLMDTKPDTGLWPVLEAVMRRGELLLLGAGMCGAAVGDLIVSQPEHVPAITDTPEHALACFVVACLPTEPVSTSV